MSLRHNAANNSGSKEKPLTDSSSTSKGSVTPQASQEKQKKLLADDAGHFSMIKALHLADVVTEMNAFCGFLSILSSIRHILANPPSPTSPASPITTTPEPNNFYIYLALLLIPFGCFFDLMDGKIARWRHKSSLMGQELDSLADLISFGAAPAIAAFTLGLRTPLDTLCLTFFVLCGLTRLARFNVTVATIPKDETGKSRYFEGFPIPSSHILVGGMAACVYAGKVEGGGGITGGGAEGGAVLGGVVDLLGGGKGLEAEEGWAAIHPIAGVFVLWGCAMVSRTIRIPKP